MSMERKKITTFVLLIVAVLIWGIIILKVAGGGRQVEKPVVKKQPENAVNNVRKVPLKLDYRDPFLGEFVRVRRVRTTALPQVGIVRKTSEQPPVPDFIFKGLIGNDSGRKAMVMKNGNMYLLAPGEMAGDFKIVDIFPEYIIVQNGKHRMEVKVR